MLNEVQADLNTRDYIETVSRCVTGIAGDSLLGLYATGSIAFDDYESTRSDVDLLGVVHGSLTSHQREALRRDLAHDQLPCPAKGPEIGLVSVSMAASPPRRPHVQFAMATGHTWHLAVGGQEEDAESILHFAICRAAGLPLIGPPAESVFGSVPREWVLEELDAMLKWHTTEIMDPYHDPLGQFSTLNACRAWCYAETGRFCSKSAGGQWLLQRDPDRVLISTALANRAGRCQSAADGQAILAFLAEARAILRGSDAGSR